MKENKKAEVIFIAGLVLVFVLILGGVLIFINSRKEEPIPKEVKEEEAEEVIVEEKEKATLVVVSPDITVTRNGQSVPFNSREFSGRF